MKEEVENTHLKKLLESNTIEDRAQKSSSAMDVDNDDDDEIEKKLQILDHLLSKNRKLFQTYRMEISKIRTADRWTMSECKFQWLSTKILFLFSSISFANDTHKKIIIKGNFISFPLAYNSFFFFAYLMFSAIACHCKKRAVCAGWTVTGGSQNEIYFMRKSICVNIFYFHEQSELTKFDGGGWSYYRIDHGDRTHKLIFLSLPQERGENNVFISSTSFSFSRKCSRIVVDQNGGTQSMAKEEEASQ